MLLQSTIQLLLSSEFISLDRILKGEEMAVQQTNNVQISFSALDESSLYTFVRNLGTFSFLGTSSIYERGQAISNAGTVITLPISPAKQVIIRNLSTISNLIVTWTPNGGVSAIVTSLTPGSILLLWNVAIGQGITALTLTTSGASGELAEYFIGG